MQHSFESLFRRRGIALFFIFLGVAVGLIAVLLRLQIFGQEAYREKVLDQITVGSSLSAKRGNIYDRNGNLLATTKTTYRIYISPVDIRAASRRGEGGAAEKIARGLASLLDKDYTALYKKTQKFYLLDETVAKNVDKETADRVLAFAEAEGLSKMVHVEATNARYYPYSSLAAQVIGFTGGDNQGLFGLELYYDEYLSGTDGKYVSAKDAGGRDMENGYIGFIPATDGLHLTTTLDVYAQAQLERVLLAAADNAGAKNRVSGIVMDVKTGGILAMATLPSYDLNNPYQLDEASLALLAAYEEGTEEYKAKKNELLYTMWKNKAISETYEPGSTFKIITTAMGLESGVVTPESPFHCSGAFSVGGVLIHCHKRKGHGSLNFERGLQQSCNPVFMQVGARVGVDAFYAYVEGFGYLCKTGIDLPSETGSIFHKPENIHEVELATASFGQRFNVSMLQQITAISAVANGGTLLTPHLLSSFVNKEGETILSYAEKEKGRVISEATAKTIATILEAGVSGDGGAKNAYVAGYQIAAKTGTSEKLNGGRVGSCVAYAPANDPEIAAIIIVDEPSSGMVYGSVTAAPYLSDLFENLLPYFGNAPHYTEEEARTAQITVGAYEGMTKSEAAAKIRALGLSVEYGDDGAGDTVMGQVPESGTTVTREGGKVILYTGGGEKKTASVPNIVGKSAADANIALLNAGFNIRIIGARNYRIGAGATAVASSHAAGEVLPCGSVITVTFRYLEADEAN